MKTKAGETRSYESATAETEMCPRFVGILLPSSDGFESCLQVLHVTLFIMREAGLFYGLFVLRKYGIALLS